MLEVNMSERVINNDGVQLVFLILHSYCTIGLFCYSTVNVLHKWQ